ncbi:hypothetical protein [Methylobacterium sp. 22177]|uniref:hypothetical protein n=1 Tax=Methylobacterium sp. 22177 TaxID=3453885 RepID=UPI003F85EE16
MIGHPVLTALADLDVLTPADLEFIRQHGRSYRGILLPDEIEPWPRHRCLDAADALEDEGWGRYVRGFALRPGSRAPLMHAWTSRDRATAIDAVWSDQPSCRYWGLDREHEAELERLTEIVNRAIEGRSRPAWYGAVFGGLR